MKWAGDTQCSSRARQLTPGRQPVAAAQHRAAVRAAAVLLVLLQQHRARSAVDGAVNWRTTILLLFVSSYNSHNNCHWIVHLTFPISSSLTSAPAQQRVVGCVHNGVNLEPGDVSLVQRHLRKNIASEIVTEIEGPIVQDAPYFFRQIEFLVDSVAFQKLCFDFIIFFIYVWFGLKLWPCFDILQLYKIRAEIFLKTIKIHSIREHCKNTFSYLNIKYENTIEYYPYFSTVFIW